MYRMSRWKSYWRGRVNDLKRIIVLTEAALRNCDTPVIKDMHYEAIKGFRKKLHEAEKKLEQYDKS